MIRRRRHLRTILDIEIANKQNFRAAARRQRVCAMCGYAGKGPQTWDAHHVVSKSKLKDIGFAPEARYDTRNVLRVCNELALDRDGKPRNCHFKHEHSPRGRIPLSKLTDDNIDYAFEILGPAAYDYLRRRYDGEDQRVDRALQEAA